MLVGGGVALLAVAVGAWWWMRGHTPDDRLSLEGEEDGSGKKARRFDPSKLQGALKARPSLKAMSSSAPVTAHTSLSSPPPDASTTSGGAIDPSQRGVTPPAWATTSSTSSYFYTPPTR